MYRDAGPTNNYASPRLWTYAGPRGLLCGINLKVYIGDRLDRRLLAVGLDCAAEDAVAVRQEEREAPRGREGLSCADTW